ncbi:MAG: hypothetical protein QM606_00730 [Leucobacter sp.]
MSRRGRRGGTGADGAEPGILQRTKACIAARQSVNPRCGGGAAHPAPRPSV